MIILSKYQTNPAPTPAKTEESPSSGLERNFGRIEEVSGNWTFGSSTNASIGLTLTVEGTLTINSGFTLTLAPRGNATMGTITRTK